MIYSVDIRKKIDKLDIKKTYLATLSGYLTVFKNCHEWGKLERSSL